MCAASLRKLLCKASAMNGSATSMAMKIARIFGTKTRVVSWICVSACNSEMATPTTSPTSISGEATSNKVSIASLATSITSGPVILSPNLNFRFYCRRFSDRHFQNVLIGRDHLVAHRDQRLHRGFGLGDCGDDVDHVGFTGRHGVRLGVGFLRRVGNGVDHVLQNRAEVRRGIRRGWAAAEACGLFAQARERGIGIGGGDGCRHGLPNL